MRTKLFLIGLFCLVVPCDYLASQSPQSAQTQQDVLSQNAAHFSDYDFDKPYFNRPVAKDGTVDLSASMLNDYGTSPPGSPRIAPEEEFQRTLDNFPVILIGVAVEQQSTLMPRGSFIISDWKIRVTHVYKNTSPLEAVESQQVTVARTGGHLTVGNLKLIAKDGNFPDFQLGHTYLLGLMPLVKTNSFKAEGYGSFDVTGPKVAYLVDPGSPTQLRDWAASLSPSEFLEVVGERAQSKPKHVSSAP